MSCGLESQTRQEGLTWLITSTTYGTWLPGDPRGFVGRVRDARPDDPTTIARRIEHDKVNTDYDRDIPGLYAASKGSLKRQPVWLTSEQAKVVVAQFELTARYRSWDLHATAVMANQFHLVVTAPVSRQTDDLLRDFKSYASRELNRRWGNPRGGTWWTASGSRRRLPTDDAISDAVRYVLNQPRFLARWLNPRLGTIEQWLHRGE
ncbi:MAG: transposase [Gemmataceae bacterium]|nr:transposase [Gemmataceae bacterium]